MDCRFYLVRGEVDVQTQLQLCPEGWRWPPVARPYRWRKSEQVPASLASRFLFPFFSLFSFCLPALQRAAGTGKQAGGGRG